MLAACFIAQIVLCLLAMALGRWLGLRSQRVALAACVAALAILLIWPLLRLWPTLALSLLGPALASCVEVTGLFIPACLLFSVASRRLPRPGDRRALVALAPVCAGVMARVGWWMVSSGVGDLGPQTIVAGVARQSTGYTCAAASMVTLLHARGIDASETEMARLALVEVGGGTTDSRVVWGLTRKLAGTPLRVSYRSLNLAELIAAPKPCLVQLDWGFFVSHMVPVMDADTRRVVIGDPLSGPRELPTNEFARQWKGCAIIVE